MTTYTLEEKLMLITKAATADLGLERVIMAAENGERPKKQYAAVNATNKRNLPVHRSPQDADGKSKLQRHQTFLYELQFYGKDCMKFADVVASMLETDELIELCLSHDVAWSEEARIDYLPALLDDLKYEPRSILRIEGRHTLTIEETLSWIETVNVTGATDETEFKFTAPTEKENGKT